MKKLKSVVSTIIAVILLCAMPPANIYAVGEDDATLSELTVRALDSSWSEIEMLSSFTFNPETTEYSVILSHDTTYVQISGTTSDDGASTSLPSYNYFRVYSGENTEEVEVTSANGVKLTYTINLTVLTESEEEEYIEQHSFDSADLETTVIDEETYYLSPFLPGDVETPNGFDRGTYTRNDTDYEVLVNSKKGMNVFYLYSDAELSEGGLYVLNESGNEGDEFYPLQNIKVKSRMYTIVSAESVDSYEQDKNYFDDFTLTQITIGDETVDVWEIEEDGDFYLVYAANWNGDVSLYCYDTVEECLQRYDIDSSTIQQLEAAGSSYTDLQSKYNDLVSKYNTNNSRKWKAIAALGVFSVVLIFVMINLILRLKSSDNSEEEFYDDEDAGNDDEPIGGYEELTFDVKDGDTETDIELVSIDDEDETALGREDEDETVLDNEESGEAADGCKSEEAAAEDDENIKTFTIKQDKPEKTDTAVFEDVDDDFEFID